MTLRFIIDKDYDHQMCFVMLRSDDWESRATSMGINYQLAKSIHDASNDPHQKSLRALTTVVNQTYESALPFMKKTKDWYQQSWNAIIEAFSLAVQDLTYPYPWEYDEYTCVLTHFSEGISNWNGTVIGRWWRENPYTQRRITAQELLIAHYFSIHRRYFPASGLHDDQIWQLAEIAAFALTGLEQRLKAFWPWDTSGYTAAHNYPFLIELQENLKQPFINRKSFQEYIESGIALIRHHER